MDPAVIVGSFAGVGLFVVCVLVPVIIGCCVKSENSSQPSKQFTKFRVVDAPNPSFDTNFQPKTAVNGSTTNYQEEEEEISRRLPAKLPSNDAINDKSGSEYSYALPSEIRDLTFLNNNRNVQPMTKSYTDSETVPHMRRHGSSTDSQIPSKCRSRDGSSNSISSPADCEDYCSPVNSGGPNSPTSAADYSTPDDQEIYMTPATNEQALYMQIKSLNVDHIDRELIEIQGELGSGNFGNVLSCIYNKPSGKCISAAKTLKETSETIDKIKFLQEAAIMGQFHHPNVVELYGVVVTGSPLMIVLELMPKGDLRNFLLQIKPDTYPKLPNLLLNFCRHIALGMDYLSKKCFIHRDLAARNILLSKDLICKIGDFGLARDLMDEEYYISHGGLMPVKWTAPEALNFRKYSTASDVWSYGCLLYEIWSLGNKPYGRKTNKEALSLIEEGYRLHPPPGCTRSMYFLMIQCWHPDASSRPPFEEIVTYLKNSDETLLSWTDSDEQRCGSDGQKLGSALSSSESLFIDLQMTFNHLA